MLASNFQSQKHAFSASPFQPNTSHSKTSRNISTLRLSMEHKDSVSLKVDHSFNCSYANKAGERLLERICVRLTNELNEAPWRQICWHIYNLKRGKKGRSESNWQNTLKMCVIFHLSIETKPYQKQKFSPCSFYIISLERSNIGCLWPLLKLPWKQTWNYFDLTLFMDKCFSRLH